MPQYKQALAKKQQSKNKHKTKHDPSTTVETDNMTAYNHSKQYSTEQFF